MSNSRRFVVSISGLSARELDQAAADLEDRLIQLKEADEISRIRENKQTMDFGASIAIALGAPAAVAIAKGIADWLRKRGNGKIVIKTPEGSVVFEGTADNVDVPKVIAALKGE